MTGKEIRAKRLELSSHVKPADAYAIELLQELVAQLADLNAAASEINFTLINLPVIQRRTDGRTDGRQRAERRARRVLIKFAARSIKAGSVACRTHVTTQGGNSTRQQEGHNETK
jgi:hypothetical protein